MIGTARASVGWLREIRGWLALALLWLAVSFAAATIGWGQDGPARTDRIVVAALASALLALAIQKLKVRRGEEVRAWSPRLFLAAAAIAWLMLLTGRIWNAADAVSVFERPEEVLGELPPGYRYTPLSEAEEHKMEQATPPGWRYVSRRVVYGRAVVASATLVGREDGARASYSCGCVQRYRGAPLRRIELGSHEALTAQMSDGRTILISQSDHLVTFITLRNSRQLRVLGRAIVGA